MPPREDRSLLIVEDSPEDLEATLRALRRSGFSHAVAHCADGDEALDYLHRRGRFGGIVASTSIRLTCVTAETSPNRRPR